jgi:hypothetical protein
MMGLDKQKDGYITNVAISVNKDYTLQEEVQDKKKSSWEVTKILDKDGKLVAKIRIIYQRI